MSVYVTSDLHGLELVQLKKLLQKAASDRRLALYTGRCGRPQRGRRSRSTLLAFGAAKRPAYPRQSRGHAPVVRFRL